MVAPLVILVVKVVRRPVSDKAQPVRPGRNEIVCWITVIAGLRCPQVPLANVACLVAVFREDVAEALEGSDMVFVTAGMGGGTGTGAAPVIAEISRSQGSLTIGVVTRPFIFEGRKRIKQAETGITELRKFVDTIIVVPNQRLLGLVGKNTTFPEALKIADNILLFACQGISELITIPSLVNLDFADVKTIMSNMGDALMGTGFASGEYRASEAAQEAISSPLLEDVQIKGARGVLVNITGGSDLTLHEVNDANNVIYEAAGEEANIIFGASIDEKMDGQVRVTVIATGFGDRNEQSESEQKALVASDGRVINFEPAMNDDFTSGHLPRNSVKNL